MKMQQKMGASSSLKPIPWYAYIMPFFLALVAAAVYYPSLSYNFQFDDLASIVKYFDIRQKTLSELFFSGTRWVSYWLNTLYYALAKHFFGDGFNPFIYRLGSVAIHLLTGILIFFIILVALRQRKDWSFLRDYAFSIATLTSALFLLHPLQTQTVSYVIQAGLEGMAGLLVSCMVLLFLLRAVTPYAFLRYILTGLFFFAGFLACGTKEIAIVTPLLIMLIDWFFVAQGSWSSFKQRLLLHGALMGLMWSVYLYLLKPSYFANILSFKIETRNNIGNMLTHDPTHTIKPYDYCISQFKVILHYLSLFVWPFSMSVDYDWKLSKSIFAPDSLLPLVVLSALAVYLIYRFVQDKKDVVVFAFAWFFIIVLPRASIVPSTELIADYKTYAASMSIFLLLSIASVWLFSRIVGLMSKNTGKVFVYGGLIAGACLLGVLSYATVTRNKIWRSPQEFWWDIVVKAPNKARAYNNYGVALSEKGNFKDSIPYYKKAIAMDGSYPDPCNNLAVALGAIGDLDNAINAIKMSIRLQPYYPEGYNNLASFLMQKKDYQQAELALQQALQLRPSYGKAFFNMARLYLMQNRVQDAHVCLRRCCLEADFDNQLGFGAYGNLSMQLAKYDEAIVAYENLLKINPADTETAHNLAFACAKTGDFDRAHTIFDTLMKHDPQSAVLCCNRAEVYALQGNFAGALACYNKADEILRKHGSHTIAMARCLDKMGRKDEARSTLHALLAADVASDLKKTAQATLKLLG